MRFQDLLIVNLLVTCGEAYVLLRTQFPGHRYQEVFIWSFVVNFAAQLAWALLIWPFFVNPLRHLPTPAVRITPLAIKHFPAYGGHKSDIHSGPFEPCSYSTRREARRL
jgi:hypothetical protein